MSSSKSAPVPSEPLTVANNNLAIHLHRQLAKEKKNVFFSPFSISTAMAMVFLAAEGKTAAELKRVLGYDDAGIDKNNLATSVQRQTSDFLKSHDGYTLTSANAMLFEKGMVKDDYKSILNECFKALLLELDFHDIESVVKKVNDWVKEKTKGMIPKFIETLNPSNVFVLLNAVYFKGSWLQKFHKKSTAPGEFYNYGDKKKAKVTNMMNMKDYFRYTEKDSYQALQLPYIGEDIAMMILLPNKKNGLTALETSLSPSFIEELSNSMEHTKVKVTLPKFRLEYSKSLLEDFKKLGVKRLFFSAQLGGANDCDLVVSEIYHKAVLEVNEEGSEAAAATMVCIARCMPPEVPLFMVDHPFAFVIYDIKKNLILFMGRVEEL